MIEMYIESSFSKKALPVPAEPFLKRRKAFVTQMLQVLNL
jgi:hypothetical protein